MKVLTKEEEQAHYNATLKGGAVGGITGLALGAVAVVGASRRYPFFRGLTLPLRAFLITSAGTFAGIVTADHYSHAYERSVNPIQVAYEQQEKAKADKKHEGQTFTEQMMEFGRVNRYKIVVGSWIGSMFAAFALVNRNKFLTGQQKLVQARVYAQFLTLGVLVASAAFEISDSRNETGRYETVKYIDPNDPEHKRMLERQQEIPQGDAGDELWKDMIKAEEDRIKEREEDEARIRKRKEAKEGKGHKTEKKGKKHDEQEHHDDDEHKQDSKDEKQKDDGDSKKEKDDKKDDKKEKSKK